MYSTRAIVFSAFALASLFCSAPSMADHPAYAISMLENSYSALNQRFMALVIKKDRKSIEELLKTVPDINVADGKGVRLIHYVAYAGDIDILKLLIDRGVDPKAATIGGWTALHYAAQSGQLEMVEVLVNNGLQIEAKDLGGETPLFYAIEAGRYPIVQLLVARGADVNNGNNQGQTPLSVARERKYRQIIDLLAKAGAKEGVPYKPDPAGHD